MKKTEPRICFRKYASFIFSLLLLFCFILISEAYAAWPGVVPSRDGLRV